MAFHAPALKFGAILIATSVSSVAAGNLSGTIRDATNGNSLPGANIVLSGTAFGSAADRDGVYRIPGIPAGDYTMLVSYIGYKATSLPITIVEDRDIQQNVELAFEVVAGQEVVVTAQLAGQAQAINQQLASNTIVNVVSADRIQELPDQNAAESLGRLPGISIERDAGEGTKVVIRGLSPKFNSITVNGERIPSTDPEDRSVDLSMISPELLAGIEVFKALTPDMDADAVGGTVNFVIRKAPAGLKTTTRLQTGYNSHEQEYGQYKGSFSASNRLFSDRLGIVATGSVQRANRSSDLLDAGYLVLVTEEDTEIRVNNLNLGDRLEIRERFGASIALDYSWGDHALLYTTFWGRTDRNDLRRRKRYRLGSFYVEYDLRDRDITNHLLTHNVSGKHQLGALNLGWRLSSSTSQQDIPFSHTARFRELDPFYNDLIENQGPELIPQGAKNVLENTFFKDSLFDSSLVIDRDVTAQMDFSVPFKLGRFLAGKLKLGLKQRFKDRERDNTRYWTSHFGIDDLGAADTTGQWSLTSDRKVRISNFTDQDVLGDEFLNGRYLIDPLLDRDKLNDFLQTYRAPGEDLYILDPTVDIDDYEAGETIYAQYAMVELKLGERLMFMPGVRFERTVNNYRSIFGNPFIDDEGAASISGLTDTTGGQDFIDLLPMVHLRYRLASWTDLRLAATKTLSRPNYFNLVPWRRVARGESTIEQGNPELKHTQVWNYDIFWSLYNRLGLFTLGMFYKELENIDYIRNSRVQGGEFNGFSLTEPVNTDRASTVTGWEVEVQTNFKFLPGLLSGIVLYANYSQMESETFYPLFLIGPRSPDPPFSPTVIDTFRTGRMPGQVNYIGNFTLGYDLGGFTGRVSAVFQGSSLGTVGRVIEGDGFTAAFTRWDIALQQRISKGFSIYLNLNNISNTSESTFLSVQSFPTREEFFGWSTDLGFRFNF